MPLTMGGFTSRQALEHPKEEPKAQPLEQVLKFNAHHDARGRFASAGGGRRGGTEGPPTEDAFGNQMGRMRKGKATPSHVGPYPAEHKAKQPYNPATRAIVTSNAGQATKYRTPFAMRNSNSPFFEGFGS